MELYRRLLTYLKPYRMHLFWAVVCMVLYAICMATLARLMKPTLDDVFIRQDLTMLKYIVVFLIFISVAKGIAITFRVTSWRISDSA